jgi:hypothetical protein
MTGKHTTMTAAELLSDALGVGLNQIGGAHGCVPLLWSIEEHGVSATFADRGPVLSGMTSAEHTDAAVLGVLTAWAALFNLAVDTGACPGTREYRGTVAGVVIHVWGVTDRDVFERGLGGV